MNSTIPVPTVFIYAVASDETNTLGVSYIHVEKLSGKALPTFEIPDNEPWREPTSEELERAQNVHQQPTDVVIELARHTFSHIGALRETQSGTFTVVEYFDLYLINYLEERATAYLGMEASDRGPYKSIFEFYSCISKLNISQTTNGSPDEDTHRFLADYETLAEMASKFVISEFDQGPFVIGHNDLTIQNILVDDECNITGIIDFPGSVVPLPSLCVFPWIFYDNLAGPVANRGHSLDVFTSRASDCQSSPLVSQEARRRLMDTAQYRARYEQALLGLYARLVVPSLFKHVYEKEYSPKDKPR